MSANNAPPDATAAERIALRQQKKRELDRKSQRMARDRTRTRIAYLENLVKEFKEQDCSGRTAVLMAQVSELQKERDELKRILRDVVHVTKNYGTKNYGTPDIPATSQLACSNFQAETGSYEDSVDSSTTPSKWPTYDFTNVEQATTTFNHASQENQPFLYDSHPSSSLETPGSMPHTQASSNFNSPLPNSAASEGTHLFSSEGFPHEITSPIIPADPSCECSSSVLNATSPQKRNQWRFANEVLTTCQKPSVREAIAQEDSILNETIPIRAVVEGWSSIENILSFYPSWQVLRQIDEGIFYCCGKVERLGILLYMSKVMQSHVNYSPQISSRLPAWSYNRPSQLLLPHSYAISYFTWPGIRERFVFSQHRYCNNKFWELFAQSFRFLWPFEFRDCYSRNTETGLYTISPTFEECLRDIKCWTMGPEIFKHFPEILSDIPASDLVPARIDTAMSIEERIVARRKAILDENEYEERKRGKVQVQGEVMSL